MSQEPKQGREMAALSRSYELRALVAALLFAGAGYIAAAMLLPTSVFWSPDEGCKYIQLESLRWHDGLRYEIAYPAAKYDPEFRYYPSSALYPQPRGRTGAGLNWSTWFMLVSKVFHAVFGMPGLYVLPWIGGLLSAAIAGWVAFRIEPAAGAPVLLITALASPILVYSLLFWEHTLGTALGLAALVLFAGFPLISRRKLAAGASCLALAVLLRQELILLAVAMGLVFFFQALRRRRDPEQIPTGKSLRAGAAALALLALILFLSRLTDGLLGNWVLAKESFLLNQMRYWLDSPARAIEWIRMIPEALWEPTSILPQRAPAWLSAFGTAGAALCLASIFIRRHRTVLLLGGSLIVGLYSGVLNLIYPQHACHNLLTGAPLPILVFNLSAFRPLCQERSFAQLGKIAGTFALLAVAAYITTFFFKGGSNGGGLEWGPRFLLTLYPLGLSFAGVSGVRLYRQYSSAATRAGLRLLMLILVLSGAAFQVQGILQIRDSKARYLAVSNVLTELRLPVVTEPWSMPAHLAVWFLSHELYSIPSREGLEGWMRQAAGRIQEFVLIPERPLPGKPHQLVIGPATYMGSIEAGGFNLALFRFQEPVPKTDSVKTKETLNGKP
jgi:hypothetical protein